MSTSLDPYATSVEFKPGRTDEQEWRFRHTQELRCLLLDNLPLLGVTYSQQERFTSCGSHAWVQHSAASGRYRVRSNACNLRWCPACRRSAASHTTTWVKQLLTQTPLHGWKLITLTLRHSSDTLKEQVTELRAAFRRLRQRKFWKASAVGGLYVVEVSSNDKSGCWHPHIHILVDSQYIPQPQLAQQWLKVTRTSCVVDIRAVTNPEVAAAYLTKYLTKSPPRTITENAGKMAEYIQALHGARMINRFGSVAPFSPPDLDTDAPTDWEPVGSLASLLRKARYGDSQARHILLLLGDPPNDTIHPDLFTSSPAALPGLSGGT